METTVVIDESSQVQARKSRKAASKTTSSKCWEIGGMKFTRGRFGAYWVGGVAVFLIQEARPGEWDGKPPVSAEEWDGQLVDVLARQDDATERDAVIDMLRSNSTAHISSFWAEKCQKGGNFSPAENAGYELLKGAKLVQKGLDELAAQQKPRLTTRRALMAAMPKAKPSPVEALQQFLSEHQITTLGQLRELALAAGLAGRERPSGKVDIWQTVIGFMRHDAGVTEAEIAARLLELVGDEKRSTTRTNLAAFRLLLAGGGEGSLTIVRKHEEGRGAVLYLYGIELAKDGILAELAKLLARACGATQAEAIEHMVQRFPERAESVKSTVATQISMWRSIIRSGASSAVFTLATSAVGPIYRVSDGPV
mgnify:CR=1 FL=1